MTAIANCLVTRPFKLKLLQPSQDLSKVNCDVFYALHAAVLFDLTIN